MLFGRSLAGSGERSFAARGTIVLALCASVAPFKLSSLPHKDEKSKFETEGKM
jgi:hypothetical protein